MQASVKPIDVAPPSAEPVAERDASSGPRRLTLPVILMINAIVLLTLGLILYFVLRNPPAAVPTVKGAKASADSAAKSATDSAKVRGDSAGVAAPKR